MTTFTQLSARLKNFLRGWLLVSSLKECLKECATLCVKSEVILVFIVVDFQKVLPYFLIEIVLLWMVWRGNVDKSYCASHIQILEDDNLHNYIRYMELIMIISVYMIAWRIVGVSTYWDEENAILHLNMFYRQLVKNGLFVTIKKLSKG